MNKIPLIANHNYGFVELRSNCVVDLARSHVGKVLQPLELAHIINNLPKKLVLDKEKLTRFLLLTAFLDQQAESPSARKTAIAIYNVFGDDLFFKPHHYLIQIDRPAALKEGYEISPIISRVLPRFGWLF